MGHQRPCPKMPGYLDHIVPNLRVQICRCGQGYVRAGVSVGPREPQGAGVSRSCPLMQRILEDKEEKPLPAALVQPHTGTLRWFLDEAAARLLSVPFEKHSTL